MVTTSLQGLEGLPDEDKTLMRWCLCPERKILAGPTGFASWNPLTGLPTFSTAASQPAAQHQALQPQHFAIPSMPQRLPSGAPGLPVASLISNLQRKVALHVASAGIRSPGWAACPQTFYCALKPQKISCSTIYCGSPWVRIQ